MQCIVYETRLLSSLCAPHPTEDGGAGHTGFYADPINIGRYTELQIRGGGVEDSSKIIFLISQRKPYVVAPH